MKSAFWSADYSEIKYENEVEIVGMENVTARIISKDNTSLIKRGNLEIKNLFSKLGIFLIG